MAFDSYYPESLAGLPEKELRKEYTRLRDIGQKRIKRLLESEYKDSETARQWKKGIPKLADLESSDIPFALAELHGLISSPYSTIRGQNAKRKEIRTRLESHYPGLNLQGKKLQLFFDYMNMKTSQELEKIYGSDRQVLLFKEAQKKNIDIAEITKSVEDFNFFLDNIENLAAIELDNEEQNSVSDVKKLIESEIYHGRDRSFAVRDFYNRRSEEYYARKLAGGKNSKRAAGSSERSSKTRQSQKKKRKS